MIYNYLSINYVLLVHTILTCSQEDALLIEKELMFILKLQDQNCLVPSQYINLLKSSSKQSTEFSNVNTTEGKCVAVVLDLIDFLFHYFSWSKTVKIPGEDSQKIAGIDIILQY